MNYYVYLNPLCAFALLVVSVWLMYRFIKKKKREQILTKKVPEEILNTFEKIERRRLTHGNTENPYETICRVWQGEGVKRGEQFVNTTEPNVESRELYKQSIRGEVLQDGINTSSFKDTNKSGNFKQPVRKFVIKRRS